MNYRIKEPKQVVLHAQGGSGAGFIDGVWHGQPPKREWVGLTEDECIGLLPVMPYEYEFNVEALLEYTKNVEAKLKEKNT